MTPRAPQPATTHHCWRCHYPLPTPTTQQCPECGHTGHPVTIPRTARARRFAIGTALIVAAVASLPLLAAAVAAMLRL